MEPAFTGLPRTVPHGHIGVLHGLDIVVYDAEIEKIIGENGITWDSHDKMGISVVCLFDYLDGDYKVYLKDDLMALTQRLNKAALVVAFNHIHFDNKLLRAHGYPLKPDAELFNYDMLVESRKAVGLRDNQFIKGFKLDDHLRANYGEALVKTSNGEEAPRMYQRGEMSRLITYCLGDVRREKKLFETAWIAGEFHCGIHGMRTLRHPRHFMRPDAKGYLPWPAVEVPSAHQEPGT